jgi:hypothetical protein
VFGIFEMCMERERERERERLDCLDMDPTPFIYHCYS